MREASHEILTAVQRRRRMVIQGFLWALFAIVVLAIALNIVLLWPNSFSPTAHWPNLVFAAAIGIALVLNHRHRFRVALSMVIGLVLLAAAYPLFTSGIAGNEVSLFLFYIPIVLAGLLLGGRSLLLVAGLTLLVVLTTALLKRSGELLGGMPPAQPEWTLILQFVLILGIVVFFLERFGSSLNEALEAMAEREVALEREMEQRRLAQERLGMALSVARMASYDTDWVTGEVTGSDDLESLYGMPTTRRPRPLSDYLELIHPDDREAMLPSGTDSDPGESRHEFRVQGPDGRTHWLTSVSKAIAGDDGGPTRVVGIVIDTTERKEAQLALEEMNETLEQRVAERTQRLEAANRELETFAYSVSHDLRAPLRGISGFSQILIDEHAGSLDDEARGYLKRVRAAAERMGDLIDDLLKLSRIAGGEVLRHSVDLGEMAREVAAELNERSSVPVALAVNGAVTANGDPKLLRIVMENLLGNAWKFMGEQPEPRVEFGAEQKDRRTVFYVRDNGVGFDMAYAAKLFMPFQRLQEPGRFEGSGIGLATVQRIVQRHGGEIWADSRPGQGATFSFTLEPMTTARSG